MPGNPRVHYNLGLLLQFMNEQKEAEKELIRALELDPYNTDFLYALADHYGKSGQLYKAREIAERMVAAHPTLCATTACTPP